MEFHFHQEELSAGDVVDVESAVLHAMITTNAVLLSRGL
jgi:hypothetical protein